MNLANVPVRLLVALALVVSVGCIGDITPTRQIDDAILSAEVLEAFAADPDLRRYDITVNSRGSLVTLLGRVDSEAHRQKAERVALGVSGVSQVDNQLRID
jgi:hyperosmotically inducible periplasmic protein